MERWEREEKTGQTKMAEDDGAFGGEQKLGRCGRGNRGPAELAQVLQGTGLGESTTTT